jgi:hypothetical protein
MDNEKKTLSTEDKIGLGIVAVASGATVVVGLALYAKSLNKMNHNMAVQLDRITDSIIEQINKK